MVEEAVASLTINLLATGIGAGASISRRRAGSLIRQHQIDADIDEVATEFNKALKQAIEEEDEPELEGFTDNWQEIADELASTEAAPDTESRHDHEEMEVLFANEEDAVRQIAEAYATVEEFDLDKTPQLREAMEKALARAYRRAVSKFKQNISDTELADVFQAETGLVLADRLDDLQNRLEEMEKDVAIILTQDARNEGFRQLHPTFLARQPPSPETCWRVGFSLADVEAGIAAERGGIEEGNASQELFDIVGRGEDRVVVGRPGSGKSTLCKQVAVQWYDEGFGDVLYRESGSSKFESTDDLEQAIERGDGHVLVVVEDVVRQEANGVLEVMEVFENADDVSFLFDSRRQEFDEFDAPGSLDVSANRRRGELLSGMAQYSLPALSVEDVKRVCAAFEDATGRSVRRDAETLHEELRPETDLGIGDMLLLTFFLPATDDEQGADGLEAHVRARYETLENPDGEDSLLDLSELDFDPDTELLADVGVMVNLLNASGIGIHQELVHALCHEYGHDVETHEEIEDILEALEGWFLFPDEGDDGTAWTTHELWSTLYLRELALQHAEKQASSRRRDRSEERTGRCLDSLFRLFDDEEHREKLRREFPGSPVLESIASEPRGKTVEYLESIFEIGERWFVLAPLFGTTETVRYELPETASEREIQWVITTRGHAHQDRGAYKKARTEHERVLARSCDIDDPRLEAVSLNNLGLVADLQGKYEDARKYYQESLKIKREIGDIRGGANSLNNLGTVARTQGEYEDARKYYQESLKIKREIGNRKGEASSLRGLGIVARIQGKYEDAQEYQQESLEIARDIGDLQGEKGSLHNLGNVALDQGEYEDARKYYQEGLEIAREIGDYRGEADCLDGLGLVADDQGEYENARKYHKESLEIKRKIDDRRGEANSLQNLGNVAFDQGEHEKARKYHKESLKIAREIGDPRVEAASLHSIGLVAEDKGEYKDAHEYYQESLDIARNIGYREGEANSLHNLGNVAGAQGEYEDAQEYYESALDIFHQLGAIRRELKTRQNLIRVEIETGETQKARERCGAAFERLDEIDRELPEEREKLEELREDIPEE